MVPNIFFTVCTLPATMLCNAAAVSNTHRYFCQIMYLIFTFYSIKSIFYQYTVLYWVIKSPSFAHHLVCSKLPSIINFHMKKEQMMSEGSEGVPIKAKKPFTFYYPGLLNWSTVQSHVTLHWQNKLHFISKGCVSLVTVPLTGYHNARIVNLIVCF